ncbi:hypothetical protein KQX54_002337 [Cotesia glomerata]|uniref:Uncharacterized protein n=1 Tax=Cotesia glomerata TaxID=32391 RepID=A0AAV7J1T4_COTGL|nr:hypothetical protein KQX54_002337 [Cotesia glomerata]
MIGWCPLQKLNAEWCPLQIEDWRSRDGCKHDLTGPAGEEVLLELMLARWMTVCFCGLIEDMRALYTAWVCPHFLLPPVWAQAGPCAALGASTKGRSWENIWHKEECIGTRPTTLYSSLLGDIKTDNVHVQLA